MRRVVALVSAVNFYNFLWVSVLAPLLPLLARDFGFSKGGAGVLTASYAAGVLAAAIPGGVACGRFGVRATVAAGLAISAASSILFVFAPSTLLLDLARFGTGVGAATSWAGGLAWLIACAPADRRAETMGLSSAIAVGGSLLGPMLGGAAAQVGLGPALIPAAAAGFVLAGLAWLVPEPERSESKTLRETLLAARRPKMAAGLWLGALSALLFAVLYVLAPLSLDELGWSTTGISAIFLVSAVVTGIGEPLAGRLADRRGPLVPARAGLLAAIAFCVGLPLVQEPWVQAALVVGAGFAFGVAWLCGMAIVADASEKSDVDAALAMTLMNLVWAVTTLLGAGLGGTIAGAVGDVVPYAAAAVLCAATFVALRPREIAGLAPAGEAGLSLSSSTQSE